MIDLGSPHSLVLRYPITCVGIHYTIIPHFFTKREIIASSLITTLHTFMINVLPLCLYCSIACLSLVGPLPWNVFTTDEEIAPLVITKAAPLYGNSFFPSMDSSYRERSPGHKITRMSIGRGAISPSLNGCSMAEPSFDVEEGGQ